MKIPGFRCAACGDEDVFAFTPGDDPVICEMITVRRGIPVRAWCAECAPWRREDVA